jgi:hypothetical protein
MAPTGVPLIPTTISLTSAVLNALKSKSGPILDAVVAEVGGNPNIEEILSHVRALADVLGHNKVNELDGPGYRQLGEDICKEIGQIVNVQLPEGANPFSELASWIGGTTRDHSFEIFTPNYDWLFEKAFERARIPYFDGFSGACEPFFEPATISNADLPARWARIWKLHGSLGWRRNPRGEIIRTPDPTATELIYPTHLKYEQTQRLPYSALFERLRQFLRQPDSLLMTCGFSFSDPHIHTVIDESLAANPAAAVMAFQFGTLDSEVNACRLALRRAGMSVYADDGALINCVKASWKPGELVNKALAPIRASYWGPREGAERPSFLLGDFSSLARYIALTRADQVVETEAPNAEGISA